MRGKADHDAAQARRHRAAPPAEEGRRRAKVHGHDGADGGRGRRDGRHDYGENIAHVAAAARR